MKSPSAKIHNMVLDFFYKRICQKKTNAEIFKEMQKASVVLPPMSNDELEGLRQKFKEMEHKHPAKMAEFRKRLKV